MTFTVHPDLAPLLGAGDAPALNSWKEIRDAVATLYRQLGAAVPERPEVRRTRTTATTHDGAALSLTWFTRDGAAPGPAVVYAHGGGMVAGDVDLFAPFIAEHVSRSGVPFLAVSYRLAPEVRGTVPAQDVLAGLKWLRDHADEHGVDPERIALFGHSSGGGLVAGAAILARDQGIPVARQILISPMLDDRTVVPDQHLTPVSTWTYANNALGWAELLDGREAGPVEAPARLEDPTGLPPAYLEVGELDIFRDETVAYATRLWRSGISTELHVHPGLNHGFDNALPAADFTLRVIEDRVRVLQQL